MLNYVMEKRRYFVVFGGFITQLTFGNLFTSYLIKEDMVRYLKNNSYSTSVGGKSVALVYGLMAFGWGTSFSLGGFIERKIGPSLTVLIGGWLMSINICLMYFTLKSYLSIVVISYGLFVGIGMGIAYGSTFRPACTWFPNRKGIVIAFIQIGFILSPFLSLNLQNFVMAPMHIDKNITNSTDIKDIKRLPESFLVLGLTFALFQFIGSILVKNNPSNNISNPENKLICEEDHNSPTILSPNSTSFELETHQIIWQFDFWILWLLFLMNNSSTCILLIFCHTYGKLIEIKGQHLSYIVITNGVHSCLGNIFWGYLIDKKPFKVLMIFLTILTAIFIGTLNTMICIKNPNILPYIYGLWSNINSFLSLGSLSMFPVECAKLFGMKNLISNYGILFTAVTLSCAILDIVSMYYLKNINYDICFKVFLIGSVISLIGGGLTLLYKGKIHQKI